MHVFLQVTCTLSLIDQVLEVEKVMMDVFLLWFCELFAERKFGESNVRDVVFLRAESVLKRVRESKRYLILADHESCCFD